MRSNVFFKATEVIVHILVLALFISLLFIILGSIMGWISWVTLLATLIVNIIRCSPVRCGREGNRVAVFIEVYYLDVSVQKLTIFLKYDIVQRVFWGPLFCVLTLLQAFYRFCHEIPYHSIVFIFSYPQSWPTGQWIPMDQTYRKMRRWKWFEEKIRWESSLDLRESVCSCLFGVKWPIAPWVLHWMWISAETLLTIARLMLCSLLHSSGI